MAATPPVRASLKVLIPLSAVMLLFTGFSLFGVPSFAHGVEFSLFTTTRLPEHNNNKTGEHFLTHRRKTAPFWLYQGLHTIPAVMWSVMIPLQHMDSFRKKYPTFHRTAGYLILSGSLVLSLSGLSFLILKHAHSHPNVFHLHDLNGWAAPFKWPTFEIVLYFLAPPYWLTLYKTAVTARAKDFVNHRKWAVLHTIVASVISMERVSMVGSLAFGVTLRMFPKDKVHEFFQVPQTVAAMAAAELDMFAFINIFALGGVMAWMYYEFRRAGFFKGVMDYLSSTAPSQTFAKKVV
ncbi:hypothetical protein QQS21_008121 [Conoideocrella luteorostrata]|uniref:Uncharacterized protein n=1 Tax=Conoideocrella luteorostrata TaxID=1105319 RepID=A0AAJ0CKB9_9HYPO|nr:hypothetical protein QQS21_008121 [Conoideocrella luteorostrata]